LVTICCDCSGKLDENLKKILTDLEGKSRLKYWNKVSLASKYGGFIPLQIWFPYFL